MEKIVGITIGPILDTITESKKISEIANASLFFSTIVFEFLSLVEKETKYQILSPTFDSKEDDKFYPDRILIKVKQDELTREEILKDIETIYLRVIKEKNLLNLKEYINFNILVEEMEEEKILEIFQHLDGIELIKNFSDKFDRKKIIENISEFLNMKKTLSTRAYDVDIGNNTYEQEGGYRAVIALDLDNMGKYSSKSSKLEDVSKISTEIYQFIKSLNEFHAFKNKDKKNRYNGLMLYSAGDDILAILNPLYIPEFLEYACNCVDKCFKNQENQKSKLTISFGIFVCYAKHPIKEAIEKTYSLLFQEAKTNKNEAVILFQKHSGQSFKIRISNLIQGDEHNKKFGFDKGNIYYKHYSEYLSKKSIENKDRLLNTMVQKLSLNAFVFKNICRNKRQVESYLEELFDEKEIGKYQLEILSHFLEYIGSKNKEKFDEEFDQLLSFFRILKFYASKGGID